MLHDLRVALLWSTVLPNSRPPCIASKADWRGILQWSLDLGVFAGNDRWSRQGRWWRGFPWGVWEDNEGRLHNCLDEIVSTEECKTLWYLNLSLTWPDSCLLIGIQAMLVGLLQFFMRLRIFAFVSQKTSLFWSEGHSVEPFQQAGSQSRGDFMSRWVWSIQNDNEPNGASHKHLLWMCQRNPGSEPNSRFTNNHSRAIEQAKCLARTEPVCAALLDSDQPLYQT